MPTAPIRVAKQINITHFNDLCMNVDYKITYTSSSLQYLYKKAIVAQYWNII